MMSFMPVVFAQTSGGDAYVEDTVLKNPAEVVPEYYPPQMSGEDWQSLTAKQFPYANEKEPEALPEKGVEEHGALERFLTALGRAFHSGVLRWLLWIAVAFLVVFFIAKLVVPEFRLAARRKSRTQILLPQEGHDPVLLPDGGDLDPEPFVRAGDFRRATRVVYLGVLTAFAEKGLVQLRPERTDEEYYQSLSDATLKQLFRRLLLQYQYAWFGDFQVTVIQWEQTRLLFEEIKQKLGA